ncbi:MAG: AAA family ATPase [Sphingomonadaceae bacterium]|nr:AAA family ATPase [Sphingomonadaceae bacterium]
MTQHSSIRPRVSLIERAAKAYDFRAALEASDAAPEPVRSAAAADEAAPAVDPAWKAAPFEGRLGRIARDQLAERGFIIPDAAPSVLAEEYRIIKRELLLDADTIARGRVILVASGASGEGKTFSAVNLALSCAQERDIEVVLVDADVAKPEVLATLGLDNGPGLLDALADPTVRIEDCLIRTDVPNLVVLPAGTARNEATELLASGRTKALLEGLIAANPRRLVILDSPPALAASPASVLALVAGQALVVVRADKTPERALRETVALLNHCPQIRLLLNSVEYAGSSRRFGSYYGQVQ